jgi:hypothetical protein
LLHLDICPNFGPECLNFVATLLFATLEHHPQVTVGRLDLKRPGANVVSHQLLNERKVEQHVPPTVNLVVGLEPTAHNVCAVGNNLTVVYGFVQK